MSRMLAAVVASAAAAATLTFWTPAPVQADGVIYDDLTSIAFRDAAGDASAPVDLRSSDVTLDPNLPYLEASTTLGNRYAGPSYVVLRLGVLVGDRCEPRVEVVSNRASGSLVRDPGQTNLPPARHGRSRFKVTTRDRRLDVVPDCAVLEVVDGSGVVLDSVEGVVTHSAAGRGELRVTHYEEAIVNQSGYGGEHPFKVSSSSGPVYDVAVDVIASDPGLTFDVDDDDGEDDAHLDVGDLRGPRNGRSYYLELGAAPGMHTLTLRVSGGNAATSEVTMRIWGRGGPALAPRDSLAGQSFFTEWDRYPETGAYYRIWTAFAFLDDTWVRTSYRDTRPTSPAPYRPCVRESVSCRRYAYDARTGELQVGTDRGELHGRTLRLYRAHDRSRHPRAGTTIAFVGQNLFLTDEDPSVGTARYRLTLRKDGTFTRTSQPYMQRPVTQRGRYRIGSDGLLVARTSTGKVVRTGLAFRLDERGRPAPQRLGVYAFEVWYHPVRH